MLSDRRRPMRRRFYQLALIVLACASLASASATLLLEEPYGKLGFFTATGHAAVYLSGVCADTPVHLRPCLPGETGIVISRYDGIGRYDWIAIPLIPYLYAVERPEDVPLFADAKMVAFLRDRYRRQSLESVAPDGRNGETPGGNWYELVGSSYDRTIYGFEVATSPERDRALIRKLNSQPNRSHFRTVANNCADFAKDIINFYYPGALHRSVIADVGITTPKQMAKMLVKFNRRHPEIAYSRLLFAQVPGSTPRSFAVHGVVESFLKSKKYILPSAIASPVFAGCVFVAYEATGAGRFEPGRGAFVFDANGQPERPLDEEDLRSYRQDLKNVLATDDPVTGGRNVGRSWARVQAKAQPELDAQGRPILRLESNGQLLRIGASPVNVLSSSAPLQFARQLLEARLSSELRPKNSQQISESEISRDWTLLQHALSTDSSLSARVLQTSDTPHGNRP
jgi:hypothetical protein